MSKFLQLSLLCVGLAQLTACSTPQGFEASAANPVNWLTPYKVEVVQGNFVSKEQVDALKLGMNRNQVRELLGTPLVHSLFHADRWDYVFTLKRQNVEPRSYRLVAFFKDDTLVRYESDFMPSETEFVSQLDSRRTFGKVSKLEVSEEELEAIEAKAAKSNAGKVLEQVSPSPITQPPPLRSYPPLEGSRL